MKKRIMRIWGEIHIPQSVTVCTQNIYNTIYKYNI